MSIEAIDSRITNLQEKLNQLKIQKQATIARLNARQKTQDRKNDTRRKILLGAFVVQKMNDDEYRQKLLAELDIYLEKEQDRTLFDLPKK